MALTLYKDPLRLNCIRIKDTDMFLICKKIGGNFVIMETRGNAAKAFNARKIVMHIDKINKRLQKPTDYKIFKRGDNPIETVQVPYDR